MRRSASSTPERLLCAGAVAALCAASPALAAQSGPSTSDSQLLASDRPTISGPTGIPEPSQPMRRRAFEAMRQKGRFSQIEARAREGGY